MFKVKCCAASYKSVVIAIQKFAEQHPPTREHHFISAHIQGTQTNAPQTSMVAAIGADAHKKVAMIRGLLNRWLLPGGALRGKAVRKVAIRRRSS